MMPVRKSTKAKLEEGGGSVIGQKSCNIFVANIFNTKYDSPENGLLKEFLLHPKSNIEDKAIREHCQQATATIDIN